MSRRNWKRAQPRTMCQAVEWSLEFAAEHRLNAERIGERMGLPSHWVIYKWASEGRMPAVLIPAFEHACGINLVSRWLAATGGKLLVDLPTGRNCTAEDMQELQAVLHTTTGALLAFYSGAADAAATLGAIQVGLESLAWHRGNVQQHAHPQLELGDHGHE
ncbi:hypothetical protein [Pseudomonas aeruginosa]|uniref:hypothetical protein n=1 Tax=Pseudomonas aeruginosa TaxID=287 RepID=UPI001E365C54|nr:hypothetical protein [Pseudomonas aeruginosa]MCD2761374.1 hypothetical protein [Pseudomonas aeruginosa]HBP0991510.1 hypothetical protein [Pseudomonas aeruginosa]HBP1202105.1 hypothetical protein [Pseudomonas aeruginosa]